MNVGQHKGNDDADNSDVGVGNSNDDADHGSVNIACGENVMKRRGQRVQQCHGSHNDNDKIEYGYCRSQWKTTCKNSCSSTLTPPQIMEQETYYRYAKVVSQWVVHILQLILLHQASYMRYLAPSNVRAAPLCDEDLMGTNS